MLKYILCIISGLALTTAYAPFGQWYLSVVSLAIFFSLISKANPTNAFKLGFTFGFAFYTSSLYWIFVTLFYYGAFHYALASTLTVTLTLLLSLFIAIFGFCAQRLYPSNNFIKNILILPACWTLIEWVKSWAFTGFPWMLVSQSGVNTSLKFWFPILGSFGTSFLLCISAGAVSYLASGNKVRKYILFTMIPIKLVIWLPGLIFENIDWTKADKTPIHVAAVQFNIPPDDKMYFFESRSFNEHIIDKTFSLPHNTVVIWPESAILAPYQEFPFYMSELNNMTKSKNITLVTGATSRESGVDYNSMLIMNGESIQTFGKQKLVPMGDYIPLTPLINEYFPNSGLPMSTYKPAPLKQSTLYINKIPFQPLICFEIIFPEIVRDSILENNAEFIINISEDGWFRDSIQPFQHLQIAQVRALETGKYIVRGTNRGISAIIDNHGQIQGSLPILTDGVLEGDIFPSKGNTPYLNIGSSPIIFLLFLLLTYISRRQYY